MSGPAPELRTGPWPPPASEGPMADPAIQQEVATFLTLEAEAYDDRRYPEWTGMVADDFTYRIPVPVVRDNPFEPTYDASTLFLDETKESIVGTWFARFAPDMYEVAWGEHPPPRFRHFLGNIRVRRTPVPDEYLARVNVELVIVRHATPAARLTAERFDTVRSTAAGWRLAARYCVLDDVLLIAPQLRVML